MFRKILFIGFTLTGLVFSTQTFATGWEGPSGECFDPEVPGVLVTPYGAKLACPSGYEECSVRFDSEGGNTNNCNTIEVEIEGDLVVWDSTDADPSEEAPFGAVDAIFTKNRNGKKCLYSFGSDTFEGLVGYDEVEYYSHGYHNNRPKKVVFCTDLLETGTRSLQPTPELVANCDEIHGVTFACDNVPAGETRTIIITKDTEKVSAYDEYENYSEELRSVPGFGFLNDEGNIDFNNVCQCVGPGPTEAIPACNPDPNSTRETKCTNESSETPVNISITNPKCFSIGGFVRCF